MYGLAHTALLFRYRAEIPGAIHWWQAHPGSADEQLLNAQTGLPVPNLVDRFVRIAFINTRPITRKMNLFAHSGPWRLRVWIVVSLMLSLMFLIGGFGSLIAIVRSWVS
jgi:hypothetical protein